MKKNHVLLFVALMLAMSSVCSPESYEPRYFFDTSRFPSLTTDNLTLRGLTPWATGFYAIATVDTTDDYDLYVTTSTSGKITSGTRTITTTYNVTSYSFMVMGGTATLRINGSSENTLFDGMSFSPPEKVRYPAGSQFIFTVSHPSTCTFYMSGVKMRAY